MHRSRAAIAARPARWASPGIVGIVGIVTSIVIGGICAPLPLSADVDLGKKYKATLDDARRPIGRDWTSDADDVWALEGFQFAFKKDLRIAIGPSRVVFGKCGTDVVWAALLADAPGTIESAPAGAGEAVTSIFLRFHPSLVRKLFPPAAVAGKGPASSLIAARRIYQHKIGSSFQIDNMPVVPPEHQLVLDCETAQRKRRFFIVDTQKGTVEHAAPFLDKPLPEGGYGPLEGAESAGVFDQVWEAFDREYAMFAVKPGVDWPKLKETYRPLAVEARDRYELAGAIALLLSHLEDLHVSVEVEDEPVWCFNRVRVLNANWNGTQAVIGEIVDTGKAVRWCKRRDGIGYVAVMNLVHKEIPATFDGVLDELKDTRGLILDLRFNGGGDELMARAVAGRFLTEPRIYSFSRFRSGPAHDDLGPKQPRVVDPRGPWTYSAPLAVLCGEKTMSSAESFACMLAQAANATLIGDRTAGSSGNPRRLELPGKIVVNLPRWIDLDHEGHPIDRVGVKPDVAVDAAPAKFTSTDDPVVREALRRLESAAKRR